MSKKWSYVEIIVYKDDPEYDKKVDAINELTDKLKLVTYWEDADDSDDSTGSDIPADSERMK